MISSGRVAWSNHVWQSLDELHAEPGPEPRVEHFVQRGDEGVALGELADGVLDSEITIWLVNQLRDEACSVETLPSPAAWCHSYGLEITIPPGTTSESVLEVPTRASALLRIFSRDMNVVDWEDTRGGGYVINGEAHAGTITMFEWGPGVDFCYELDFANEERARHIEGCVAIPAQTVCED